jgi:hypothetical protein
VAKGLENSGVDWRILQWLLKETGLDDVGGIHLAQHREEWQAVGNVVINFGFTKMWGIS